MKAVLHVFAILFTVICGYPQIKDSWRNFPMRRMVAEPKIPNDPNNHVGSRIVNGREVTPHEIPYQVWLILRMIPGGGGWSCGGSLITKRFVLTAAHCIMDAGIAEVHLGVHNTSDNEPNRIIRTATNIIPHVGYVSSTITNDIGVIGFEDDLELTEYVNIVKLPRRIDLDQLYEGENVRVSGWGLTAKGGNTSDVLMAGNSTVISNAECKAIFSIFEETEICISGKEGVGVCSGDSGGPLVAGDVQIGIVSYATRDCVDGYPSAFTRITSYLSWIVENTDYVYEDQI